MKKRKWHSLLILIILICAAMLLTQFLSLSYMNYESLQSYEQSIIEAKTEETLSFSKLINNDFYTFFSEAYSIFSDNAWRDLRVSMEQDLLDSHYLEYARRFWSDLSMKQLSLGYVQSIQVYFMDKGKMMTSSSIVDISDTQYRLLDRIVHEPNSIALVDNELYFWVPQYYPENGSPEDMRVIVTAKVPSTFLKMYLEQFSVELSESNLLFSVVRDGQAEFYCALRDSAAVQDIPSGINTDGNPTGHARMDLNGESSVVTWAAIGNMDLCLYQVTPWRAMSGELDSFSMKNTLLGAASLITGIGFVIILYLAVSRPMRQLQQAIRKVRKGDLTTRLGKTWATEYQDVYDQFNRMTEQIQELIEHQYAMQLLTTRAELSQLQYQINPHFLYNTYFNLRALLEEEDYERAIPYADILGKYLGYITHSGQTAALSEEVEYAKAYGEIQKLRFSGSIDCSFGEVPEAALRMEVPKLILQPLIENAYEHGVRQNLQGGVIQVRFSLAAPDILDVYVDDNGGALTDERIGEMQEMLRNPDGSDPMKSVALLNIQRRLTLFYHNDSRLEVTRSELGGLKCCLHIHGGNRNDTNTDR